MHSLSCQKPYFDQAGLSSLVNKQVEDNVQTLYSVLQSTVHYYRPDKLVLDTELREDTATGHGSRYIRTGSREHPLSLSPPILF